MTGFGRFRGVADNPTTMFRPQNRMLATIIPRAKVCYLRVLRELIETNAAKTNENDYNEDEVDRFPTLADTSRVSGSRRVVAKPMRELAAAKARMKQLSEPCSTANCEELRSPFDGSCSGSASLSGSITSSAPATLGGTAIGPGTDIAG